MGQAGLLGLVLGQCPGLVLVDILVGPADELEHLHQGVLEGVVLHLRLVAAPQAGGQGDELHVVLPGVVLRKVHGEVHLTLGLGHHARQLRLVPGGAAVLRQALAEVLTHHGGGAADQVAQVVGQVGVDAADEGLVGEVAVGAEGELPQQEVAQGVHPVALGQQIGVHHIALGLAHLAAVQQQPAVAVHLLGQGQAQGHEDGGPDDGVEAHDLLAHKVHVGGPELLKVVVAVVAVAQGVDVVGQGVDPHIHHVAGVEVHRHAPGEGGAGDAQILQAGLDEVVHHLIDPAAGLQEVGVLQQMPDAVGVLGQAEEVGLLLGIHHVPAAVGALAVLELGLRPEGFAGLAILAHIFALVDVPLLIELLEDLLHGLHVVVVGGADEPVVGDVHQLPQVEHAPGALHDVVDKLLGGYAGLLGLVLDLLAVLVGAGEEHDLTAPQALVAGHGVGGHGAVGVADVQFV